MDRRRFAASPRDMLAQATREKSLASHASSVGTFGSRLHSTAPLGRALFRVDRVAPAHVLASRPMRRAFVIACLAGFGLLACGCAERSAPAEIAVTKRVVAVRGVPVAVRECGDSNAPCVLFLHGAKYSSKNWEELGTLALVAKSGRRAIAIDLPGFGETPAAEVDAKRFVLELVDALSLAKVALVAPSMSGRFAFPFIVEYSERLAAFVPIAPVGVDEFAPRLKSIDVPTLVVWGAKDSVLAPSGADVLAAATAHAEKFVIEGAEHACYLAEPKKFHERLLAFFERALGPKSR